MNNVAGTSRFSVGLTGGIGSGKSTIADLFAEQGAAVIDTDRIAHQLTAPNGPAIETVKIVFGKEFIAPNGAMDRGKMRDAVFADPLAKKKLETILHPLIRSETERAAACTPGIYLLFVVPLLVESGPWKERMSRILVIDCPEEIQIRRVMQRNGFSEQQVRDIMINQAQRTDRLAIADDVIKNDGNPIELLPQVKRLHQMYVSLSQAN